MAAPVTASVSSGCWNRCCPCPPVGEPGEWRRPHVTADGEICSVIGRVKDREVV